MDVQDDPSQRVLGVAVVQTSRPRDGVVADELIFWIPGRDKKKQKCHLKEYLGLNPQTQ